MFSFTSATDAVSEVHFIDNKIHLSRQGSFEMVGQRAGKLYHLDLKVKVKHSCTIHFKTSVNIVSYIKSSHSQSETALPANVAASLHIWNHRLANLNQRTILKMSSKQMVEGLDITDTNIQSPSPCEGCLLVKMNRMPFPTRRTRATAIGTLIHSDVCKLMQVITPGGSRY